MPVYILVKAKDGWDPVDPMIYNCGYMIHVRDRNQIGGMQVPPDFVQIELTDDGLDPADIERIYCAEWARFVDYEFIGHDSVVDGHRLNVFTKPEYVSVSSMGILTREDVEQYLDEWNASIVSISPTGVVFDMTVYGAVTSRGFWRHDIDTMLFQEKSYDQITGIHRIQSDYTVAGFSDSAVDFIIVDRGGVVVNHPGIGKVTFDISRTSVSDVFKLDVKKQIDGIWARRKFKILEEDVQTAINSGGTLSMTWQQFAQRVYNRLDD